MTREIIFQGQFKRDVKKHFLDLATSEWAEVLGCLVNDLPLAEKYRDHALVNDKYGYRDCHVKPDLVLIYGKKEDTLILVRLGSHSEIFG
ncbi:MULTISPECIES: type II toxin-antitoxin system YafQ family toxin [Haemophilus]|uniref:mRNA interferase YafQ n=2 Tax=Haemophilus TaxID=724 RepID=A0AB37B3N6_HAEIF|nr:MULTISPECIES: type II toxin-antitoxin system YafQ family toxin [Haemophilus]EGT75123.1 putative plasmid stabilization system [Haemophilus haemolyticus M19501]PRJ23487.1 mRNA interferase YafQ [Haemophilus influenzae]PRL64337.1 mRNA interferase YafQ [Haemophilus influenzae]PRL64965.1 mRNA interferase YafQ [Haemophilus influenzae]PRM83603.1 mRNA interferase YafQ [Haemophilus influenzae]